MYVNVCRKHQLSLSHSPGCVVHVGLCVFSGTARRLEDKNMARRAVWLYVFLNLIVDLAIEIVISVVTGEGVCVCDRTPWAAPTP